MNVIALAISNIIKHSNSVFHCFMNLFDIISKELIKRQTIQVDVIHLQKFSFVVWRPAFFLAHSQLRPDQDTEITQ